MNKLYNEEIKKRFLNETYENEESRSVVEYIFYYSYGNEVPRNKDLYNFTLDEIGEVIANSRPKSLNVAKSRGNFISQYISWAIDNNLRTSNINPMQSISNEWYQEFIDKDIKKYISKKELDEIDYHLVNNQDRAILQLLFYGVYGKECSEIRNLKISDVKFDGNIRLYDDEKGERYLQVSEELVDILKKAYNEEEYLNKNGTLEHSRGAVSGLYASEYIIKNVIRGRASGDSRVSQHVVLKRVKTIAELFDLPDLTPNSIHKSGMIYMAHQILEEKKNKNEKEELTQDDFEKIAVQYNISPVTVNGYTYYNKAYMKQFINEDNIANLYG